MKDFPIGILDSGLGGLSIWRSLVEILPYESTVYIGDHAHFPYGNKSTSNITQRVNTLIRFLLTKKTKLIIVACNTATVAGIDRYRKNFSKIPIIGVVPVIKTAAAISKSKRIAVLTTPFTADSQYQNQLIHQFARDCNVYTIKCSDCVMFVEKGQLNGLEVENTLRATLIPYMKKNIDVIVLGCTHFPFLGDQFRAIVGNRAQILDSGGAVARHAQHILGNNKLLTLNKSQKYVFYTNGNALEVTKVATTLLVKRVTFKHVDV